MANSAIVEINHEIYALLYDRSMASLRTLQLSDEIGKERATDILSGILYSVDIMNKLHTLGRP